uniref:hypothetical protein n=1 Tax=uncultured Rhizobium sp. TaxID=155567 RepID=UPI00261994DF|nr:hypothetical protein [uncultured Rhizobium sp.]
MSAYFGIENDGRSYLFTDAAAYSPDGIVRQFVRKVELSERVPFAITTHGDADLGARAAKFLAAQADKHGIDVFVDEFLPLFLHDMAETYRDAPAERKDVMAYMAVWSETRGIMHLGFQTVPEPETATHAGVVPFTVEQFGKTSFRGSDFPITRMASIRPPLPGESQEDFVRNLGVTVLGFMREQPSVTINRQGKGDVPKHRVGGWIDMTIVDASGARCDRVHTWDDKIGEYIQPFAAHSTVIPFAGNRAARRAAGRLAA